MTLYEEYAHVEAQITILENQKDKLRPMILKDMVEQKQDKIETAVGKFVIAKLKSWVYSEKVVKLGEDYKEAKAREESTGEADYTEKDSLRFIKLNL